MDLLNLGKIIWIDVLLSGDNALVIAAACAGLPRKQRVVAMIFGTLAAICLRVALTGAAAFLMTLPWLRLLGGAALFYVAVKLLIPNDDEDSGEPDYALLGAIFAIVVADITMSIDNMVAVAAAANGDTVLLAVGLALSIPLVVTGAAVISGFMNRFPFLTWAGAALLGWIAGDLIASDPEIGPRLHEPFNYPHLLAGVAALCVLFGGLTARYIAEPSGD